jgi:hypothetical protein
MRPIAHLVANAPCSFSRFRTVQNLQIRSGSEAAIKELPAQTACYQVCRDLGGASLHPRQPVALLTAGTGQATHCRESALAKGVLR